MWILNSLGHVRWLRVPVLAALLLLAMPGVVLAKWTVAVDFEPTRAVAGEPTELAAVIQLEGHDAGGEAMPTLADIETVQFRLLPVGDGAALVVSATADPRVDGRYRAEVTVPDAGDWRVELEFVVDGHRISHVDFPAQQPYLLAVEPAPHAAASAGPAFGTLGVAVVAAVPAIGWLVIGYSRVRRRTR